MKWGLAAMLLGLPVRKQNNNAICSVEQIPKSTTDANWVWRVGGDGHTVTGTVYSVSGLETESLEPDTLYLIVIHMIEEVLQLGRYYQMTSLPTVRFWTCTVRTVHVLGVAAGQSLCSRARSINQGTHQHLLYCVDAPGKQTLYCTTYA